MLKWRFNNRSKDESKQKLLGNVSSDSSSVSSSDLAPSQLRINKILQAYEDYRQKLLSDLDNISLKSTSTHAEDISARAKTSTTGSEQKTISNDVSAATEAINLLLDVEPIEAEKTATSPDQLKPSAPQNSGEAETKDARRCDPVSAKAAVGEACNLEIAIPELTKAIQAISEKREKSPELGDVLDMITSLKLEFEMMKSKLNTSAKSQHKLQEEVGNLKEERTTLLESLMYNDSTVSQTSGSALDVGTKPHYQSKYSLPESSTSTSCLPKEQKRVLTNPLMTTFIANLPSPTVGQEKDSNTYTDSETSWSSSTARDPYSTPYTRQIAPSLERKPKTAGDSATNKHSLPNIKTQSMFDLRGDGGSDSRKQLPTFQQVQRLRLLRELAESERRYCADLWQLTQNYGRLLYSTGAVSHRDILKLFPGHLSEMYLQHCSLLKSLNKKISLWRHNNNHYGNLLSVITSNRKVAMFSLYKDYTDQFPAAVRILNKLSRQSHTFRRVLRRSKHQGGIVGSAEDLILLLIRPIRMLPSYLAFLKEALYHTEPDHPDRFHLQSSAETLWKFLTANNKSINGCLQMSGVYVQPPPNQPMLGRDRTQAHASQKARVEQRLLSLREAADSGIDSHTDSTRSQKSHRGRPRSAAQRDETVDAQASHYDRGRSLQRYNSLRTVHPRELELYENVRDVKERSREKSMTLQPGQRLSTGADSRLGYKPKDRRHNDLVRRLGHSASHGVGPHGYTSSSSNGCPSSKGSKVRFRNPVAESAALRRAPSQVFASGKRAITDTFKVMFSRK